MRVGQEYGIADDFHADTKPFQKILDKYYYIEQNNKVNWFAALHKCRELGGDLVNFENAKEFDAVLKELNVRKCYWIDLHDHVQQLKFRSITTGHPASFLRWGSVEPNNLGGNEHCVQLIDFRRQHLIMNDNKCRRLCFFICQTKIPLQTNFVVW
ncbi:hypothetical protein KR093_005899 [Drosophila rubida]|uniref:C-type lectin domain-containing protein n=1 Tax=Drosophila rubida TaxID=30044 RepID=A0AAD4JZU8_9MUSC|nr:hypothetical protein KR093_005899 [Drosophila rubida]